MPLDLFYTMVQKSQKRPKTQIKGGGPAFNLFPAGTRKSLSIPLKFFPLATVGKEEVLTKFELNLIKTFRNTAMFPGGNVGGLRTKYIQKKYVQRILTKEFPHSSSDEICFVRVKQTLVGEFCLITGLKNVMTSENYCDCPLCM